MGMRPKTISKTLKQFEQMTDCLKPTLQEVKRNLCCEARKELEFLKKTMIREEHQDDWEVFQTKSLRMRKLLTKIMTVLPDENEQKQSVMENHLREKIFYFSRSSC